MKHNNKLINPLQFILAGNATFNCYNLNTNNNYTYKVIKSDTNDLLYFVSVKVDNDNTESYNQYEYKYIGLIRLDINNNNLPQYIYSNKSTINKDSPSVKGFAYIVKHLIANTLPEVYTLTHYGKCGRCGRTLTTEESILSGYGSECIKYIKNKNINK